MSRSTLFLTLSLLGLASCEDKPATEAPPPSEAQPSGDLLTEEDLQAIDEAAQEAAAEIDEGNADDKLKALEAELGGE